VPVIEARTLRKEFRSLRRGPRVALAGLDLEVHEGGVFGFLGPNGSGKTTTIRCLLGLVRPTAGSCRLLGAAPADLAGVIGRVGSIVETPTFFPNFSGRRNLELLGAIQGIPRRRVAELLETVGLGPKAGDQVRTYSLGMKQRLGIAAALLNEPEVLILDEPANGLDPAGIRWVRELIRLIGREGRTVFLSSHLLSEVMQVCDRVAILSRGRTVATGPVEEVLRRGRAAGVVLRLPPTDIPAAVAALEQAGIECSAGAEEIRARVDPAEAALVTRTLAERGLYLSELRPDEASLEEVFLELTGEAAAGTARAAQPGRPNQEGP
jgi:ABC-2 type transport system ATP-binding protein